MLKNVSNHSNMETEPDNLMVLLSDISKTKPQKNMKYTKTYIGQKLTKM